MNTLRKIVIVSLISLTALAPVVAVAKVGVGVGLGKVNIDESLKPGGIYKLPTLPVLNTGDEAGDYEVEVTYLTDQPELRPAADWFTFSPNQFHLAADSSQPVEVSLTLPVNARPGNYFAFLEAHPITTGEGVTIGVAAATKLNFTIKPSGILGASIERVRSFFTTTSPTSYVILGIIIAIVLIGIIRHYLSFNISLKKKAEPDQTTQTKKEDQS